MTQETKDAQQKLNRDQTVAIDPTYFWRPIGLDAPTGVKLQLLGKGGVAVYGILTSRMDGFWTHYAPLPVKPKD